MICRTCGEDKELDKFPKDPRYRGGRNHECRACHAARSRAYYASHTEAVLAQHKEYYDAHREEHKAINHRWYILHRDHCLAVCRRYYEAHRADKAVYDKLYRGRNLERRRIHNRRWARANAAYRHSLRLNREAQKRTNGGHVSVREWLLLKDAYGNKCAVPGCDRTDVTMDHIIPLALGGRHSIENIQPLCVYHNSSKGTQIIDYRKS